jgi:cytochrome c
MIKTIFATSISLLVWFFTSALVHPLPHTISDRARAPLLLGAEIAPPVAGVFERSCANCHSEKTQWPWYSRLAPMSWVVETDVKEARKHLNLSRWDRLDPDEQRLALTSIVKAIESGEMPPRRYVVLHPEAQLSSDAAAQVIEWSRTERHRLKSEGSPGMPKSPSRRIFPRLRESSVLRQIKSERGPIDDNVDHRPRGKDLFRKRCAGCHALDSERVGPRLRGVFGNPAGRVPSFPYSEAVRKSGVLWDSDSLDKWLTDPDAFIPDNDMEFRVANSGERADIISYLKTLAGTTSSH